MAERACGASVTRYEYVKQAVHFLIWSALGPAAELLASNLGLTRSSDECGSAYSRANIPPQVYGGAGVHVEYLSRELAREIEVEVHCWGRSNPTRAICTFVEPSRGPRFPMELRASSRELSRPSA